MFCAGIGVAHSDREAQDEAGGKINRTKTTVQPFHRGVIIVIINLYHCFLKIKFNNGVTISNNPSTYHLRMRSP